MDGRWWPVSVWHVSAGARKVVVLTGAAGLLGSRYAAALADSGYALVLLDIDAAALQELRSTLLESGADPECVIVAPVDLTAEDQVEACARDVWSRFNRVDALVNNAANDPKVEAGGVSSATRLEAFPLAQWEADISVGLTGSFLCAKHFGPLIAQGTDGGTITNISSDLGLIGPDQRLYRDPALADDQQPVKPVSYSVVKTALIGLTRYLATYWAGHSTSVRSNALCLGGVNDGPSSQFVEDVSLRIPLGRMARPNEYSGLLLFLLSDHAEYMNGAVVVADGGRTVW